ncbi:thiol:disulfide interchange protein DsbA/DsbL [Pseudomonas sp. zfem004]|uniref:thiol:disulfide interchange protein DsbA/DsbL n=1 Tax=Pseudomonas sp. zfem004 TaxID=3078199 RepID=UPI0029284799|nr:thiol:disulfide interchange protein DsbA/DsbL [Pseudomonas sp. zfem004]MDU9404199.1 thiol:disulfide interchange protein DsbA/DsbL [Pseudomonas sp. zfem004]
MKNVLLALVAPVLLSAPLAMASTPPSPEAGKNYLITEEPASKSPSVIEFFSYACAHCRKLDPSVAQWAAHAGKDVAIRQVPVSFGNRQWAGYAKAFYVSEALDLKAISHSALFDLASRGVKLDNDEAIIDFFVGLGADRARVGQMVDSFVVRSMIAEGDRLAMRYKVREVPSFVANGKYLTSPSMTDSNATLLGLLSSLTGISK